MSNGKKIAIIIACVMTGVGILILLAAVIGINFDFTRLNTVKTERVSYTIEEDFDRIHIDCMESDVKFVKSDSDECIVECVQEEHVSHEAEVKDGTLNITRIDEREGHEYFVIMFNFEETGVTVHLPEDEYEKLWVKTLSGDVEVTDGFTFTDAEVYCTSGDALFNADASGNVTVESVSGDVRMMNPDAANISVKSTSGDVEITSVKAKEKLNIETVSGDIDLIKAETGILSAGCSSGDIEFSGVIASGEFSARSVSGDIEMNRCDGENLYLKSTSGDISGTLLSEKMFSVHTTSGHVNVPDDGGSGKCEISTTSGNVNMRIDK